MNKINIPFKGMTNVPDDSFSQDGSMSVLLNMRHKGGELVQCQPPTERPASKVMQAMYHAQSNQWLELTQEGRIVLGEHMIQDVKSFALMGNVVIIYFADSVEYAIWRNGAYVYLGELPEVPRLGMAIRKIRKVVDTYPNEFYIDLFEAGNTPELYNLYVKKGYIDQCLDAIYKDGAYIDRAQYRVALKLFDGSYICYSPIYYANFISDYDNETSLAQGGDNNFKWTSYKDLTGNAPYRASVTGFIPTYSLSEYNLEKWEDIIISVCVFSSGSLPLHKTKMRTLVSWDEVSKEKIISREFEDYMVLTNEERRRTMVEDVMFYLVAEYDLQGKRITLVEDTSPSYLATRDVLPDYSTAKQTIAGDAHVINSKLHASKTTSILNRGFADVSYFTEQNTAIDISKIVAVTHISTDEGIKKAVKEIGRHTHWGNDISALLTYPDRRAFKMELYVLKDGVLRYKAFDLVKHKTLDMAYWLYELYSEKTDISINSSLSYDVVVVDEPGLLSHFNGVEQTITVVFGKNYNDLVNWEYEMSPGVWLPFPTEYIDIGNPLPAVGDSFSLTIEVFDNGVMAYPLSEFLTPTAGLTKFYDAEIEWQMVNAKQSVKDFAVMVKENYREERRGILKVSAVDNPFYFPTAQTYKFEGDIVALASNAEAISTGQFGQYPLFVFTSEGIWAMAVDASGQGAYVSQSPFSREVCSGAVCPVSGGIVFTTERGVMAISGGQVTELSQPLDGLENLMFAETQLFDSVFNKAGKQLISPVQIREYIKGAKLAYNYLHNEVILSNATRGYSYVYSLTNQEWSIIDRVFDVTTNSYPELVVYNNDKQLRYEFEEGNDKVPVVAITRPVKVDTLDFKRLRQAALRCTFEGSLNFYVLGSNDGASFVCITGKECPTKSEVDSGITSVSTRRDLITSMSRSKQYKYIAIAVAGNMKGRISLAEMLVEGGFASNQLR